MEVRMLAVRLDPDMEEKLNKLSKETGRSKSFYVGSPEK
jgi:predicted DNA-binding protein